MGVTERPQVNYSALYPESALHFPFIALFVDEGNESASPSATPSISMRKKNPKQSPIPQTTNPHRLPTPQTKRIQTTKMRISRHTSTPLRGTPPPLINPSSPRNTRSPQRGSPMTFPVSSTVITTATTTPICGLSSRTRPIPTGTHPLSRKHCSYLVNGVHGVTCRPTAAVPASGS